MAADDNSVVRRAVQDQVLIYQLLLRGVARVLAPLLGRFRGGWRRMQGADIDMLGCMSDCERHPSVLCPSLRSRITGDRTGLAISTRGQRRVVHAFADEVTLHGIGAQLREVQIVAVRTA